MKRIGYLCLALAALSLAASVASAATPTPTSAVTKTLWQAAPFTTLTITNLYPAEVSFAETGMAGVTGFGNRYMWGFSTDGVNQCEFENNSIFQLGADIAITGQCKGEMGLRITPWWDGGNGGWGDGFFMINSNSGEIACFGGRLPFYSFTAGHAINYAHGTLVHQEIIYNPRLLNAGAPGQITYKITIGGTEYSSPAINFDQANPAEDPPHGLYGILTPAYVGGYVTNYTGATSGDENLDNIKTAFYNIAISSPPTPATATTWSKVKALYR